MGPPSAFGDPAGLRAGNRVAAGVRICLGARTEPGLSFYCRKFEQKLVGVGIVRFAAESVCGL